MKTINAFLIIFSLMICCCSCDLYIFNKSNNNLNYDNKNYDNKTLGEETVSRLLTSIKSEDVNSVKSIFSNKIIQGKHFDKDLQRLIDFFKDASIDIDYDHSVETSVFEGGVEYFFDECLAFVKCNDETYRLDFIVSKNNESAGNDGIVRLDISIDSKNGLSKKHREYLTEYSESAMYFDKDSNGVFWYEEK